MDMIFPKGMLVRMLKENNLFSSNCVPAAQYSVQQLKGMGTGSCQLIANVIDINPAAKLCHWIYPKIMLGMCCGT